MQIDQHSNEVNITRPHIIQIQAASFQMKKNFASTDCGAKVIDANAESQGSGNIISLPKDDYMLNKCTDTAWFVVELCDNIKAYKIEIANFELFSSVFKKFRVSLGSMYPGKDKVWSLFGEFEAEELRELQTFENVNGVFGKYVKVEIFAHYGTEHYCPISLFNIYGISEIELMDADSDDHDSSQQITNENQPTYDSIDEAFQITCRAVFKTDSHVNLTDCLQYEANQDDQKEAERPQELNITPYTQLQVTSNDTAANDSTPKLNEPNNIAPHQAQRETKEGVWLKLANRIKNLEKNVNLSARFLDELSVRYKKQIEDLQLSVKTSNEALSASSQYREQERITNDFLFAEVIQKVSRLTEHMEKISGWEVYFHVFFLILGIFIGMLFVWSRSQIVSWVHRKSYMPRKRKRSSSPLSSTNADDVFDVR